MRTSEKAIRSATILVAKDNEATIAITKGDINQDSPIALASISKLFNDVVIFRLIDELLHGDRRVDYDESLRLTKQLKGQFAPGERNKAYYSNMNANLLARIAEQITGKSIGKLFEIYIFEPLKLEHTRIATTGDYQPFYAGDTPLTLPKYLSSSPAAGGVISTNRELMIFIQAFMNGVLFDKAHIKNPEFRSIQFFPMRYGSGMMSLSMSTVLSPLFAAPQIIGHSGSTGSFAYYLPSKDAFITGTINQSKVRPYEYIYRLLDSME